MQTLSNGYRGITLLFELNADRLLMALTLVAALCLGGLIGTTI